MPIITAVSSPTTALITSTSDASGNISYVTANTTAMVIDTNQNTTHTGYVSAPNTFGFKNRIINGDFKISQYNGSSSITPVDSTYFIDRFLWNQNITGKITFQQNAGSVTPPPGFVNYAGFTSNSSYSLSSSDYFLLRHRIEGYNIADFAWGTANAKPVTLSFWVYSSLTGTFGGIIQNQPANYNYTYSYTINSANTWQYVTIIIPGPTSGTWYNDVRTGIDLWFSLGCGSSNVGSTGTWGSPRIFAPTGQVNVAGTSGAVWNITGIQLEKGNIATPFDYRPYGIETMLCRRYYQQYTTSGQTYFSAGNVYSSILVQIPWPGQGVPFRTIPSLSNSGTFTLLIGGSTYTISPTAVANGNSDAYGVTNFQVQMSGTSLPTGSYGAILLNSAGAYLGLSAEL